MATTTAEAIFPYSTLPKAPVGACPVCGTTGGLSVRMHDRYGFAVSIVGCRECQLTYLGEQLTREGYARLYDGAYRPLTYLVTHPRGSPFDREREYAAVEEDQRKVGAWIRKRLPPACFAAEAVLDAGGSRGTITTHMGLRPASLTILDAAAEELPPATASRHVVQGWLEDPIAGTYDGIVCLGTLDHVTKPLAALRHLRQACPAGWLLADITQAVIKIDHPLYWSQTAWRYALAQTDWTMDRAWTMGTRKTLSLCH